MQPRPFRHRAPSTKRPITATVAALTLAGLLGACGNDGGPDNDAARTTTTSTPELSAEENAEFETAAEFAQCMRDNGIEGLPDPQVTGNGFMLVGVPLVLPPRGLERGPTGLPARRRRRCRPAG